MPHLKEPKIKQPLWKEADYKAQKKGVRNTVYGVNCDEFTGEWLNNLKHGKGTYKWKDSGAIYDGDWKTGQRNGYGTYSVPLGRDTFRKEFSGGWKNDKRHGSGTQYYKHNVYYEGEWYAGKRNGWGRMHYADGNIYEGEWYDDERNGQGMLRLSDGNRYEGSWKDDKKNGPGKYFYLGSGQLFEGVWVDDTPKSGTMTDYDRENAGDPTQYPIPDVKLLDPDRVLADAEEKHLGEHD